MIPHKTQDIMIKYVVHVKKNSLNKTVTIHHGKKAGANAISNL